MNSNKQLQDHLELKEDALKKQIGLWGLSANIINIIVGAGIFVLPAFVAQSMGSTGILAYIFCGVLVMLVMLCFAEIGSKIIKTGGPYTYIETVFGPYAGFLSGNFYIISVVLADGAVANALINVLASIWPIFQEDWLKILFMAVLFFGLAYINIIGIKSGIGLVKFTTVAKLLPLIILIVFGLKEVSIQNLYWDATPTLKQLGNAALILFFAFQGGEVGVIVTGEVIKPKKTIPKAIFLSILTIILLYILIHIVCQGILGENLPNETSAPLAVTAKIVLGSFGFLLLTLGAAISMFGNLSGEVLNNPRLLYAFSRDGVIPTSALSKIHKKFATPHIAIIVYAVLGFIIAIIGGFEQLAVAASISLLLIYLAVILALIKLRFTHKTKSDEFRIKGGLIVPVLSIVIIGYFLSHSSALEVITFIVIMAVFSLVYLISNRIRK